MAIGLLINWLADWRTDWLISQLIHISVVFLQYIVFYLFIVFSSVFLIHAVFVLLCYFQISWTGTDTNGTSYAGPFSGTLIPVLTTYQATKLVLSFHSDYSVVRSGFEIRYKSQVLGKSKNGILFCRTNLVNCTTHTHTHARTHAHTHTCDL